MKNDKQFWISVVLLLAMAALLVQNHQLGERLERLEQQGANTANALQRQVSDISRSVGAQLAEEASLWSAYSVEEGEPDHAAWILPVTVQVTPKVLDERTTAQLEMNGQRVDMTRDGVTFRGELALPFLTDGTAQVILTDGSEQRVGSVDVYPYYYRYVLRDSYAYYNGGMTGNKQAITFDGTVDISIPGAYTDAEVKPVSGELVLLVEGEEASRQLFDVTEWTEPISVPWQAELPVEQGQRLELWCRIVDDHGLVYDIPVLEGTMNADGSLEERFDQTGQVDRISDGQGRVLYTAQ